MIIAARRLSKHFQLKGGGIVGSGGSLRAVDEVDLDVKEGSIVGVVGESGSGKSTIGRLLIALLKPTSGQVLFDIPDDILTEYDNSLQAGKVENCRKIESEYSVYEKRGRRLKEMRKKMGIVFQDPYSSLDPRMRVQDIIMEPIIATGYKDRREARETVLSLLERVGLPADFALRYPHELSGGQRQRVAIARSISTLPKFLVLDEPTSALDVSVQAQILSLLKSIRKEFNISMLLITHNIAVVAYMAEYVNVIYAGKVMESGSKRDVILNPTHPYTQALISAVPGRARMDQRIILRGDPPNLVSPPLGCRFHPRCPLAFEVCGWSADEVLTDLDYLLQGKYYASSAGRAQVNKKDESSLIVKEAKSFEVSQVIAKEREAVRSLTSIRDVKDTEQGLLLTLSNYITPSMYEVENGKKVSCLLYSPEIAPRQKTKN